MNFENKGSLDKAHDLMSHFLYFGTWDFQCQSPFVVSFCLRCRGKKCDTCLTNFMSFVSESHMSSFCLTLAFSLSELDGLGTLYVGS